MLFCYLVVTSSRTFKVEFSDQVFQILKTTAICVVLDILFNVAKIIKVKMSDFFRTTETGMNLR